MGVLGFFGNPEDALLGSRFCTLEKGDYPCLCSSSPLPFQMTLYLTFPVAMFWIANQAEWFEDYVIQRKVGIGTVLTGSFHTVGAGHGPPACWRPVSASCEPTLSWLWGARGSWLVPPAVPLSPQRELWPPEKEDQVSEVLLLPPEGWGWRCLDPCGFDEFESTLYPQL